MNKIEGAPPLAWIEPIDGKNYLVVRFDGLFKTMEISKPPTGVELRTALRKYAFKKYTTAEHLDAINRAFQLAQYEET